MIFIIKADQIAFIVQGRPLSLPQPDLILSNYLKIDFSDSWGLGFRV